MIIGWGDGLALLGGGLVAALFVYGLVLAVPRRIPREKSVRGIRERIDEERRSDA